MKCVPLILSKPFIVILAMTLLFVGCQKEETMLSNNAIADSPLSAARLATNNHPGRTLAANCFQCHGTDGYGLEHLAGKNAKEIESEMTEMAVKNPRADIMNVHAKAYTVAEIKLIADYFSKQ
jgi:cytochrome subunit of sulfide dehydrogenase